PVPTVKISSNTAIAEKKPHWIDFNARRLLAGTATMEELADELFEYILDVATGREMTNNERHGYREIAIWTEGVALCARQLYAVAEAGARLGVVVACERHRPPDLIFPRSASPEGAGGRPFSIDPACNRHYPAG